MVKDNKKAKDEKKERKASVAPASAKATEGEKSSDSASEAKVSSAKGAASAKEEERKLPSFRVGDTIKVFWRIREEGKKRIQPFGGIVIAMKGSGVSRTFTVRKIASQGIGVERIFPFRSPNIQKVQVTKKGKVRRAKLYYLREKVGKKATRIKARSSKK